MAATTAAAGPAAVHAVVAADTLPAATTKLPLPSPPPLSWAAVVSGQKDAGVPSSPRTASKSFQDVLQKGPIKQKIPSTFRGEPAVFFTKEEISKLATPFRFTLVGKFSYHRPSMEIIRKFFISLELKSLQSVGLLQEKHVAIFITHEEDYTRLLMRATWYIAGAPMKVLKWTPDFYPNIESPVVPVWIGLPGLPLHFFEKSALFCIASVLGTPLKIDEATARLSRPTVARICVEVDVSKPRNHKVWLGDNRDGFWQDIVFENPPTYCGFCKILGHDISTCYRKNPELLKESKQASGIEKISTEHKRNMNVPTKMDGKDKTKDVWRRKEVMLDIDGHKDAEGWIVVDGKKKNKVHRDAGKETQLHVGEGNQNKFSSSESPEMEQTVVPQLEKEEHSRKIADSTGTMDSVIYLTPLNPNRQDKRGDGFQVQKEDLQAI